MTAYAVQTRPAPVPARVPAVASVAVRRVLATGSAHGAVLGASRHAVWIRVDDDVVVVSASDATRLPNGIEIAAQAASDPFGSIRHGDRVAFGSASVGFDGLKVETVRWWDPRPILAPTTASAAWARVRHLPSSVPGLDARPLRNALLATSSSALRSAAAALLGAGPGLTPVGDDLLAGALAATRVLGMAVGAGGVSTLLDESEGRLIGSAQARTTAFSAALIRCALRGEVAAPAGAFLRALAGRGDVDRTHRRLLSVGHSSGPALAAGIVLAGEALHQLHTTPTGGPQ